METANSKSQLHTKEILECIEFPWPNSKCCHCCWCCKVESPANHRAWEAPTMTYSSEPLPSPLPICQASLWIHCFEQWKWFYVFFSGRQTRHSFCSIWCASGKYIFSVIDHRNPLHLSDDNPHLLSDIYVLKTRWSQWGWKVFSSSHIRICLCSNGLRKNKICHQRAWWRRIQLFKLFEEESVIKLLDEEESVFKQLEEESVIQCSNALRKNLSLNGKPFEHRFFFMCSNGLRKNLSLKGLIKNLSVLKWFRGRICHHMAWWRFCGLRKNLWSCGLMENLCSNGFRKNRASYGLMKNLPVFKWLVWGRI